jgi:ATP-dependent Lon protease
MRKRDYTHLIDRYYRLNNDFNKRDEIGVRKTFSGLAKLLFPDENMTKEDVAMLLDYAIEGRRRVKEQLKIMAGVEFIDVNLGYMDADNPTENHVVYVPEQSSDSLVPEVELMPGHIFAVGHAADGDMAIYKLENKAVAGDFKFQTEGIGANRRVKDTMEAAFKFFENNSSRVAAGMHAFERDYLLFFNDLQKKGLSAELSLAEFIGLCSAACNRPVAASLVVPGIIRLSGTMDEIRDLEDILRVSKNAGAKKVLLPLSCIKDLQNVSAELLGSVSPDFYPDGDAVAAARKALGLN